MSEVFVIQLADGPGRPVVLSHALGLDHAMWLDWAASQAGKRPVLAYDHPGQGRSALPARGLTMESLVDAAASVVNEWGRGPVVWLGLSMGGMVGQGMGIRRPDLVRGLILAHTTAVYPQPGRDAWTQRIAAVESGGMESVVDLVTQRYLTEAFRKEHPDATARLREQLLLNDARGYAACCQAIREVDWLGQLHAINCPALVLAGALDAGATPQMARDIAQRVPAARLEILEAASHMSPWEQPAAFHAAVQSFLADIDRHD